MTKRGPYGPKFKKDKSAYERVRKRKEERKTFMPPSLGFLLQCDFFDKLFFFEKKLHQSSNFNDLGLLQSSS